MGKNNWRSLIFILLLIISGVINTRTSASPAIADPLFISIRSSDFNPCPGAPVLFTASVTSGSSNLSYQWTLNGTNAGADSPTFTIDNSIMSPIKKSDIIQCIVTNKDNNQTATSNKLSGITVFVNAKLHFNIFAQQNFPVCSGAAAEFGSEYNNLMDDHLSSISAVWSVNGVPVYTGDLAFVSYTLKDGDVVSCKATFHGQCIPNTDVESNSIKVGIITVPPASFAITPAKLNECEGTPAAFKAVLSNGGDYNTYQWIVNGNNAGENNPAFNSSSLQNGDTVWCRVITSRICGADTLQSNKVPVVVAQQKSNSVSILSDAANNFIVANQLVTFTAFATYGGNLNYQWQVNEVNAGYNSNIFKTGTLNIGDVVTCTVTSTDACVIPASAVSNAITILMNVPLVIPNTFTPNNDGINDTWDIKALLIYPASSVNVYDRYGALVYHSIGYPKAWDGTRHGSRLPTGVYYYLVNLNDGTAPFSGYVTILR